MRRASSIIPSQSFFRWVTVVLILIIVWLTYLADAGLARWFFIAVEAIPAGDKFGHFLLMGLLAFTVNMSIGATRIEFFGMSVLRGSLLVCVVVTLEEISQYFLRMRSFSISDLSADYLGILILGQLAVLLTRRWYDR